MKKLLTLILCQLLITSLAQTTGTGNYQVNQEIRYNCEDATEVFIVWGVNGWNKQEKKLQPPGTFEKGGLLATQMRNNDGVFSVELPVGSHTMLDYVFWITKGPKEIPCDIWDVNITPQKDYHTLAVNDNIVLVNSKVKVKPSQPLSILEYAPILLLVALLLFAGLYLVKRFVFKKEQVFLSGQKIIVAGSVLLVLCLFAIRVSVARLSWDLYYNPASHAGAALWAGYYDYLYVVVIFVFFAGIHFGFRKFKRAGTIITTCFIIVAMISLLASLLNIRVVDILGKPFNYRWFYYSGFLNTADSKAAVASNLSTEYIVKLLFVSFSAVLFTIVLIYLYDMLLRKIQYKRIVLVIVLVLNVGFIVKAKSSVKEGSTGYERLANPVTAFVESINPFTADPELFTMEVPDSLQYKEKSKKVNTIIPAYFKNVIMIVLESTPARVVAPYDNKYKATPVIESLLPNAIVFDHVYAHAPATNKTMFSLLCSSYPWLSYNSETQEFPGIKIPSLASIFKENGYRTGFFNSGDNHFQDAGSFLASHGFETIKDYSAVNCDVKFDEKEHDLDGVDDACTAEDLGKWIQTKDKRPFFGMIWTYQTHYPYFCNEEMQNFNDYDQNFNKYLNAVKHSDKVIGQIIESLKASGTFESTLLVIIGDHGEAFGTHDQTTHASKIYEENVHIPCLFINPVLNGFHLDNIGGVVDVAPTILDFVNIKPADQWQGASLFNGKYTDRAYFFCPWSDYLFGFREGKMKYIFNASKNSSELYNLESDPMETRNLAESEDADLSVYQQKLASWVQYQDKFMKQATGK